jgi:hypothetical protein
VCGGQQMRENFYIFVNKYVFVSYEKPATTSHIVAGAKMKDYEL